MKEILIEPTSHSPRIFFKPDGHMLIEGRAIPENVNQLFSPLMLFIEELRVPSAVLDINLDYFNTATSKRLLELMKHLEANTHIPEVTINWHYESDDEDSLEMAEIYKDYLERARINFVEHAETPILFGK